MEVKSWLHSMHRKPRPFPLGYFQVSTTVETFQDLSLPIPGKEDLAKLHSAIYQSVPAKTGACGDNYASQGWIAFIMEYIRRWVHLVGALSSGVCPVCFQQKCEVFPAIGHCVVPQFCFGLFFFT